MELPDVVKEINKKAKVTRITTLDRAESFKLKRMFSGSLLMDELTGGGWAYKRRHMLYGQKSCIDGDSFLRYEAWFDGKCINHKGGSIQRLYERFTGDESEGSYYGRHLQNKNAVYYVKSVDDTGRVVRNEVLDVVKCGVKQCYEVTTSLGNKIITTMEHKYLTPNGYQELKALKNGDILFINTNNRVKGKRKLPNRPDVQVKYHPYWPIKIVKDNYKGKITDYIYYRGQKSRAIYEAFLNNLDYEEYIKILNNSSKEEIEKLKFLPENIHVHHKDEDFNNNNIDNLELIDPSEHGRLHMLDRISNLQIIVEESHITSIEYVGERMTYDLKCAYPYNNYIANGIVVHNSGKNALFNQTIAYNQRLCRHCHGILPEYYDNTADRHGIFLRWVLGLPECRCEHTEGKLFLILDYEKSLAIENESISIVRNLTDKKTGEEIDDALFDERTATLEKYKAKPELTDNEKEEVKFLEKWFKGIDVVTNVVQQKATKDYLIDCGVIINRLMVCDPKTTEDGSDLIMPLIESNSVDGILFDSLQAAIPQYVNDRDAGQATMGAEPKSNGILLRHMCAAYAAKDLENESEAYKPAFFLTSQMRSVLGGFVSKDSYSGGHVVAHLMDFIGEVHKGKYLKIDGTESTTFTDDFHGQNVRIRAEKSKLSAPGDMYSYDYFFKDADNWVTGEIDHVGELVTLGVKKGIIIKDGYGYVVDGHDKFKNTEIFNAFLRGNPEFMGQIYSKFKG